MRNLSPQESTDGEDSGTEQSHNENLATPAVSPGVQWSREEENRSSDLNGDVVQCSNCDIKQRMIAEICAQRDAIHQALVFARNELAMKDESNEAKLTKLNSAYKDSFSELRLMILHQKRIGDRWKAEMETLTALYDAKLKQLSAENRRLKSKVDKLSSDLSMKMAEVEEAREMNGIYSARLTKMKRTVKKLKDEDEESYIEITF